MANTQALKRRIKSVGNTRQITKAMELVAASKMRRAQESALRSREFRNLAAAILTRLRQLTDVDHHPLFNQRAIKTRLFVLITSDRGLAGAYNANLLRTLVSELKTDADNKTTSQIVAIGKQGAKFALRLDGVELVSVYDELPDHPTPDDLASILDSLCQLYTDKKVDAIDIIFTDFKSSVSQVVTVNRLLPAAFADVKIDKDLGKAIFEPSPQAVLDNVSRRLIEVQLWQAVLEAAASEHSMRMMAMKNASDNASELIDDLTLEFNTARQSAITQELAEITGGAEAMK